MIRAMLVDDEPIARAGLRAALAAHRDVELIGECADGPEALRDIRRLKPDLVFLDVQMPGLDGFEVLERLDIDVAVVFVTAHDRHAVRAFDVHAVDYLLKPFGDQRLAQALERVRAHGTQSLSPSTRGDIVRSYRHGVTGPAYRKRMLAKDGERVVFIATRDIEWLEADGNNVRIHTEDASYAIRATLSGTLGELDPSQFVRAHRSSVINLDCVVELQAWFGGDGIARMKSGAEVKVSRHYRDALLERAR